MRFLPAVSFLIENKAPITQGSCRILSIFFNNTSIVSGITLSVQTLTLLILV